MADLEIKDLHVRTDEREILRGVDLEISRGEIHALMGPNGSGKSTLANTLLGHPSYEITEGSITFKGEDITHAEPHDRAKAGLVDSRRGSRGGYLLARPAEQITMAEVVEALEGSIAPIECISEAPDGSIVCSRETGADHICPTKLLWTRVRMSIVQTLRETTLADLLVAPIARPAPPPLHIEPLGSGA